MNKKAHIARLKRVHSQIRALEKEKNKIMLDLAKPVLFNLPEGTTNDKAANLLEKHLRGLKPNDLGHDIWRDLYWDFLNAIDEADETGELRDSRKAYDNPLCEQYMKSLSTAQWVVK